MRLRLQEKVVYRVLLEYECWMEKEGVVGLLHDEMRRTTEVALVRVVVCGLKVRRSSLQAALQHRAYLMVSHLSY